MAANTLLRPWAFFARVKSPGCDIVAAGQSGMVRPEGYEMGSSLNLATLALDDFTAHLGADFEMQTSEGTVPLKLAKAEPVGASGREGGAFSLLFAAPAGTALPQAIYPVRHPSLGTIEIFLVPIGPLAGGNGYQAIFA
jgi:hypothetical protein